ncbi:MATE family efflux transporter [Lacrimispora saccharolytica]|uniref:Probable multidrug resistance protein NorM n=1 Tax=Lacrimispora saccharolytica (strain ATCC 35040 / DSM 2544 / NRCC 2533 / WM1) TaxID=610130 RepID=D9R2N8_LACSW|nr:MATE family efflux transporter [Lacrimispora saccharolytica]ADL06662.1 MATE efflux family protein [[Clostridium] saccharolyticum WM1]QRV19268.1 MATE family efflux transporter [Lacrimispora saccharolytica]
MSMKTQKKAIDMITDSPGRALLLFALPMILGNLFQQFYNIIDSVVVGRFVGEEALASVGASYSITNVFIAIAVGGGIGSSVVVSQFLGAKQTGNMKTAISTTLINFLLIGAALGGLGLLFNHRILSFMNTPENVFDNASVYLGIYFLGLPFLFMYNVQASVFQALGDSKTPLYLLVFSSLLNVVLDLLFVTQLFMGVAGVAIATLIAQGLSAVISFLILIKRLKGYETSEAFRFYDWDMMLHMMRVAIPSTLQQSIVHIGMLLVQSVVNVFGSAVMAGFAAGTRIESICIVPMLALGNAMSTYTAQNIGAGRTDRVKKGYRYCYLMVGIFAVIICIIMENWGDWFIRSFLNEGSAETAFQTGMDYVRFISFFYVCIGLKATTDGLLRGAGDVVVFTAANLVNLAIRVSVAALLAPVIGVQAVWFAVPMGWTANYILSFLRYLTGKWERIRLIS